MKKGKYTIMQLPSHHAAFNLHQLVDNSHPTLPNSLPNSHSTSFLALRTLNYTFFRRKRVLDGQKEDSKDGLKWACQTLIDFLVVGRRLIALTTMLQSPLDYLISVQVAIAALSFVDFGPASSLPQMLSPLTFALWSWCGSL